MEYGVDYDSGNTYNLNQLFLLVLYTCFKGEMSTPQTKHADNN